MIFKYFLLVLVALLPLSLCEDGGEDDLMSQFPKKWRPKKKEPRPQVMFLGEEYNVTELAAGTVLPCGSGSNTVCGGSQMCLQSPNFPGNAGRLNRCPWTFNVRPNVNVDLMCDVIDVPCSEGAFLFFRSSRGGFAAVCTRSPRTNQRLSIRVTSAEYNLAITFFAGFSTSARMSCTIRGMGGESCTGTTPAPTPSPTPTTTTAPGPAPMPTGCGISRPTRIVNGEFAQEGEYPWMAFLRLGNFACGGTLVNARSVMTAAHCTEGISAARMSATFGCRLRTSPSCTTRGISNVFNHPTYRFPTNDIAILRLSTPFTSFTNLIRPVCLPNPRDPIVPPGTTAAIAGWGLTSTGGRSSTTLKDATVRVISDQECSNFYGSTPFSIMCVTGISGVTCQGDSGGFLGRQESNLWVQHGVTSFGSSRGCNTGAPEGFTELLRVMGFVNQNI